jgi:xanthine/CO dehydrogenase XdhC/CoxF family maturation factor
MNDIAKIVESWKRLQKSPTAAVLATVVRVSGSHYRRPGARMLAMLSKSPVGSVSGGCLEADILERARAVIRHGQADLAHYDTTSDSDLLFGTGMGCGGEVDILIEPTNSPAVVRLMEFLEQCVAKRSPVAVATVFAVSGEVPAKVGDRVILANGGTEVFGIDESEIRLNVLGDLAEVFASRMGGVKSYSTPRGNVELLMEFIRPPLALALFGAGDDAIPVCTIASELGWQVTLIDHRAAHLTPQRFPQATALVVAPSDRIAEAVTIDGFDAAVIMTHNYQHDQELLGLLLDSKIAYIGLLGAAKRAERILGKLAERYGALNADQLGRIHAPVGLDLHADGPEAIALSIVAEIQMELSGGTGQPLHFRRQSHTHETVHTKGNG